MTDLDIRRRAASRRRLRMARWLRRLAFLAAGLTVQTATTSCDRQLSSLPTSLSQDLVSGTAAGSAISCRL